MSAKEHYFTQIMIILYLTPKKFEFQLIAKKQSVWSHQRQHIITTYVADLIAHWRCRWRWPRAFQKSGRQLFCAIQKSNKRKKT